MAFIYETENFEVEARDEPFVSRTDGGHIRIKIKDKSIIDRTQLSPTQAIELMRLTMIVGEALQTAMNNRGINVVRVNYQDMGNWAYKKNNPEPYLHVHVMGRAKDAKVQVWPESIQLPDRSTGFYDGFEPLDEGDIKEIRKQIEEISSRDKYKNFK